ncbi:MAG: carbonic anhydrase [Gammaproteobacteria bacterium]|nr:carbonic anhydrase [Gammaproteobacteria bacterium]
MITGIEAIERLKEGNQRFFTGVRSVDTMIKQIHRADISGDQAPFAIILGCSDARVPAEIVFDQGLGDLFVIRVAGNVVAPSLVGSIEFAVEQFGTPLVVVLGHSMCGAVKATLDEMGKTTDPRSSNVLSIVNRIRPTIKILQLTELRDDPDQLLKTAIRANILASTNHLRHGSEMLEQLVLEQALTIVGAEYSLETGKVEFITDV